VELHEGQVMVANRPDGGAVFTVVLPDANVEAHL
jgi:signal transduction histidine kinase